MQDNQKKYRKKYAVMTVFFLISASFLFGCGNKDSAVPETEEFLFSAEEEKSDHTSQKSEEPAEKAERKKAEADSGTVEENPERKKVFVYVCGEVQASGVYELEQDSRVFEAIAKAGGLTENAAAEAVNQARVVVDGEQIYVPSLDEVKGAGVVSEVTERTDDGKININTAEKEELMTLTGVGEAKAQSIIAYREEHGGFQSIEELMQIEGIKEGVVNKIKEDITI